jgi:hypothetical protein
LLNKGPGVGRIRKSTCLSRLILSIYQEFNILETIN